LKSIARTRRSSSAGLPGRHVQLDIADLHLPVTDARGHGGQQ
jgi:hypothetical protein